MRHGGDPVVEPAPEATGSYVSTTEILEREARLLARRQLSLPGYWRRFVRRRVAAVVVIVALGVAIAVLSPVGVAGAVRGVTALLLLLALATAVDHWVVRRRVFRAHRVLAASACPPGTVVHAHFTVEELTFSLPGHRIVLETSSLSRGVHEGGLLLLEQADGAVWVVPDELLGARGLDVARAGLGHRLDER